MEVKKIIRRLIKKFFGIDGISLFVKKQKKRVLKKIYTKEFTADDLVNEMCKMGMARGSVVFVHSAMTEFYNYKGSAVELIERIIEVIGEQGTLMMPAYPKNKSALLRSARENTEDILFDVNKTPSGAGYLSEVFRTFPGVRRSINIQHSVCAYGKLAEHFVGEHHLSEVAWDTYSPYYKLAHTSGLIFSFGLDSYLRNVTLIHCTESFFRNRYAYFSSFFGDEIEYSFLDHEGRIGRHRMILPIKGGVRSAKIIKRHFDKSKFQRKRLSNLNIEVISSDYMFNRCVQLTEKGISIYTKPDASDFILNGQFLKTNRENGEEY
ncbi:AAC(3) family N-acetyltransferase [Sphingobacterium sp. InxBP1]|uniref:AAC(3) family N-acetyltransferase n=1 Tax=Sphingobacterium sp. InxBP1 TaxID=2870328 RepID=UPI0022446C0A|nr:AAC(3) family N-acetyltransferase [Sphingobacterium sp. InxBP1]MCW8310881.1 AAC(3) family N-acetyltransferase [Sphingobacterium sp. InxBP1]